jgi:hypothetical protein
MLPIMIRSKINDHEWGKAKEWTIEKVLEEINRDHSDEWTNYNTSDWLEGWMEWVDGEYHKMEDV